MILKLSFVSSLILVVLVRLHQEKLGSLKLGGPRPAATGPLLQALGGGGHRDEGGLLSRCHAGGWAGWAGWAGWGGRSRSEWLLLVGHVFFFFLRFGPVWTCLRG